MTRWTRDDDLRLSDYMLSGMYTNKAIYQKMGKFTKDEIRQRVRELKLKNVRMVRIYPDEETPEPAPVSFLHKNGRPVKYD